MDTRDYVARLAAAEAEEQAAWTAIEAFGITDPSSQWTPEYGAAETAAGDAWARAEEARHELDEFLNPERYAREGYRAEAVHDFLKALTPDGRPDREAT